MATFPIGPIDINAENWCYVEADGVDVIHEVRATDGRHMRTDAIKIPWPVLRLALAYKDKRKRPRRKKASR